MIDHQPGIFHMKDLHDVLIPVNKNEDTTGANILIHGRSYNTAECIKTLSHIYRHWIQVISKRTVKMEHTLIDKVNQLTKTSQIKITLYPKPCPVEIYNFQKIIIGPILWCVFLVCIA